MSKECLSRRFCCYVTILQQNHARSAVVYPKRVLKTISRPLSRARPASPRSTRSTLAQLDPSFTPDVRSICLANQCTAWRVARHSSTNSIHASGLRAARRSSSKGELVISLILQSIFSSSITILVWLSHAILLSFSGYGRCGGNTQKNIPRKAV